MRIIGLLETLSYYYGAPNKIRIEAMKCRIYKVEEIERAEK